MKEERTYCLAAVLVFSLFFGGCETFLESTCFVFDDEEPGKLVEYKTDNYLCPKDVVVPDATTSIGPMAFAQGNITSVVFAEGLVSIGRDAFVHNKLASLSLPEGVESVGSGSFAYNELASLELPGSLVEIGASAFLGNGLSSVVVPGGVVRIGYEAFGRNPLSSVCIGSLREGMDIKSTAFPEWADVVFAEDCGNP